MYATLLDVEMGAQSACRAKNFELETKRPSLQFSSYLSKYVTTKQIFFVFRYFSASV